MRIQYISMNQPPVVSEHNMVHAFYGEVKNKGVGWHVQGGSFEDSARMGLVGGERGAESTVRQNTDMITPDPNNDHKNYFLVENGCGDY